MEYRVIRHAEGEEREDHKYIARVPVGVKRGKKIYRYFYDKPSYQAYLNEQKTKNQKNVTEDKNTKGRKLLKDGQTVIEKLFNNLDEKTNSSIQNFPRIHKKGKESVDKVLAKRGKESVGSIAAEAVKSSPMVIKTAKIALKTIGTTATSNLMYNLTDYIFKKKQEKSESKEDDSKKKQDGFEFESEDERLDYSKRLEYQKNEPEFMKHVADIPEDEIFTKFEDQEKVNETYNPYDDRTSRNCGNCSAAYELRRRGYDVEAKDNGGEADYNGSLVRPYDYFENATIIGILGDGGTTTYNKEFMTKFLGGDGALRTECLENIDNYNFWKENHQYTADSLRKGITDNSPPGSRGMISVVWNEGNGHSIVYEVDLSGEVIIRDSQTYDEYSLDELADKVTHVQIVRTDNLELKEEILSAVKTNEEGKRKYYWDKGKRRKYRKKKR